MAKNNNVCCWLSARLIFLTSVSVSAHSFTVGAPLLRNNESQKFRNLQKNSAYCKDSIIHSTYYHQKNDLRPLGDTALKQVGFSHGINCMSSGTPPEITACEHNS